MDMEQWLPIYEKIVEDFEYSVREDYNSALLLARLRGSDPLEPLEKLEGHTVEVIGPYAKNPQHRHQIVADSALEQALDAGCKPTCLVTDLDGDIELQLECNLKGVPAVIHAHGDNVDTLKRWVPLFEGHVIATCQCEPPSGVHNFGGFTDGDRGVVIADHFGAKEIILNGWDFQRAIGDVPEVKKRKLHWAKRIIEMIDTPVRSL